MDVSLARTAAAGSQLSMRVEPSPRSSRMKCAPSKWLQRSDIAVLARPAAEPRRLAAFSKIGVV
jgi:hypothetical protein